MLAGFYRHLVVDLAGIPSHPISFADSLFFLPEARLHKDLDAAGRNVAARYAVFVKAIHECKAAQLYHAGD